MLLEQLKSNSDRIFSPLSFMRIDKRLRNFNLYQVSLGLVDHRTTDDMVISAIISEVSSNIIKQVVGKIADTKKHDCLDVSEYGDIGSLDYKKIYKILDFILYNRGEYKNIITSTLMCQLLQDCAMFRPHVNLDRPITNNGSIYCIGDISGLSVWADPYMKYSDHRIFLFDHVDINIEDVNFNIIDEATFAPRLKIDHKLSISVGDSMILFLLGDRSSSEYQQYKSLLRDKKINNVLGEEE